MLSQTTLELYRNPKHFGTLDGFAGEGWAGSRRHGQFMRIQIKVAESVLEDVRFQTTGCVAAIACCEALSTWATGKSVDALSSITPNQLEEAVGGLPPGRKYCSEMALHALSKARENALANQTQGGAL